MEASAAAVLCKDARQVRRCLHAHMEKHVGRHYEFRYGHHICRFIHIYIYIYIQTKHVHVDTHKHISTYASAHV